MPGRARAVGVVGPGVGVLHTPLFHPTAARLALWLGDAQGAAADLEALDAIAAHGPAIELRRQAVLAGIAALEGRGADALGAFREALAQAHAHGVAWDEALIGMDMAILLGPADPAVRAAAEHARATLFRLGALPFIERLDAAMARGSSVTSQTRDALEPGTGQVPGLVRG